MGTFAKFSQDKISNALNSIVSCNEALNDVETSASEFISSANEESARWTNYVKSYSRKVDDYDNSGEVCGSHEEFWTNFTPDSYCSDREVAMTQGKSVCTDEYIKPYNTLANQLSSAWKTLKSEVNEKINNVELCLKAIETAATTFDGLSSSISSALGELEAAGMADNIAVEVNDDGVEVVYYQLLDDDGNVIGKYSISEMVNAFYTYTGSAMSSVVSTGLMFGDEDIPEGYLNNIISGVGTDVYKQLDLGFMSIASKGSIEGVYEELIGEDYNEATITKEFESIIKDKYVTDDKTASELYSKLLNDDTNALLSAGAVFGMSMAGLNGKEIYSDKNVEENKKRIEQMQQSSTIAAEINEENNLPGTVEWPSVDSTFGSESDPLYGSASDLTDVLEPNDDLTLDSEDLDDGDIIDDIEDSFQTDEEADRIMDMMDGLDDTRLPSTIDPDTRTPAEIDSEARDEYFDEMGDELYEQRAEQVEEYQAMSDDQKLSVFEKMGYSKEDAAKLIAAPAAGQTAYVYGKLNETLSMNANKIATAEGINNFISGYDNKNNLSNIVDKTANVDLTPTSDKVQTARQQLTTVKNNYDDSVTKANKAIDKADDAKKSYNKVLKKIQDENGEDPKNWTDEQVKEYNDAATMYNDAVKEAQEAAENVESAKTMYNQEKEQYQEIYDKWKEEAEEDLGDTGSPLDDVKAETNEIKEPVHDKVDDTSINIGTGNNGGSSGNTGGNSGSGNNGGVSNSQPGSSNNGVAVDNDSINIGSGTDSGININQGEQTSQLPTDNVGDTSINIGTNDNITLPTDDKPVMNVNVEATTDNISYNE